MGEELQVKPVGAGRTVYVASAGEIKKIDATGSVTPWVGKNGSSGRSNFSTDCGVVEVGAGVGVCAPGPLVIDALGTILFIDKFLASNEDASSPGGGQVLPTSDSSKSGFGGDFRPRNVLGQLRRMSKEGVVSGVLSHRYGLGGVAVDAAGNIYVGELSFKPPSPNCNIFLSGSCSAIVNGGSVWKLSPTGAVTRIWTNPAVSPVRIVMDASGNLYVGANQSRYSAYSFSDRKIVKLSPDGEVLGTISEPFTVSGDFTVDAQGNLVIASSNRVRKISPAGLTTEFGLAGSPGAVDGPGEVARFSEISGLAFDPVGNIFVADRDNHAIRKISPAGIVSTVVGKLGSSGIVLGDLPGSLYQPSGLAFDKEGMLYISSGDAILKVKLP